ncbi:hypothetical protein P389DRAFT_165419 [Cystobasidium minutum MCA 4210]|uniref:uncharacterized protein n=1 Tax=Cystobasidium minutum MCA 4210 TaxID=1397322 RepID=UPI0034CF68CA|eukprot:jgi/Rhomi1/165419/fgenesh1_kg.1_\
MDDMDDSIFALLAGSSDEEEGLASTSYRELPREQVWSDTALVDAWSAALAEFVNASSSQSTGIPVIPLDREHQLLASPLWYAPLCPPSGSKSNKLSSKREREEEEEEEDLDDAEDPEDQEQEEEAFEEEYADEEGGRDNNTAGQIVELESTTTTVVINGPLQPPLPNRRSFVHPSRLDHVKEHQPYIDLSEWQPVVQPKKKKIDIQATALRADTTTATTPSQSLAIPDPPTVENALPQDSALTDSQPPEQALERALHAWYTAGYAAALYHIRSGLVKP